MRPTLTIAVLLSLAACRTSKLGSCSSDAQCPIGSVCDKARSACVIPANVCFPPCDNAHACNPQSLACEAVQAADVRITSPAADTVVGATFQASATARAPGGVSAVEFEVHDAAGALIAHAAGTAAPADASAWSASLSLGGVPNLSATLTAVATHPAGTATSAPVPLKVQTSVCTPSCPANQLCQNAACVAFAPSVTVVADGTPYARTTVPVPVPVLVSDPVGVPDGGVLLDGTQLPVSRDGGLFVFNLDPMRVPAGVEGPFSFSVTATDNAGNTSAPVAGTRVIDDAPPAISVRVFKGSTDPGGAGVIYPAAVPNTGWSGVSFVYSDTVHVKGTLTDLSGVGAATLHVDGTNINGAPVTGAQTSLGCTAGATTCNFDVQVALNAAQPEFHTGATVLDGGVAGLMIPSGMLQLTIDAQDQAKSADGTAAAHAGSSATPARATRLLWKQAITVGNVVGMAVHPNGDLYVTGDSNTGNSVYDLAPDQPLIRWSQGGTGAANPDAGVLDAPAIGAGDATTAPIYVANSIANVYAFAPDGGLQWSQLLTTNFMDVAPAVDNPAWAGSAAAERVVVPDSDPTTTRLWAASSAGSISALNADIDQTSAPLILGTNVWFGTGVGGAGEIEKHALNAGSLGAAQLVAGAAARPYWGLITDGTTIFAATDRLPNSTTRRNLYSINPSTAAIIQDTGDSSTVGHLSADMTFGIDGQIYVSRWVGNQSGTAGTQTESTTTVNPSTLTFATPPLVSIGSSGVNSGGPIGHTPLQGSDGNWYLPTSAGNFSAYQGSKLSWMLTLPGTMLPNATMDCGGRVFVASGNTVYALISDDHGLADTPWPSRRRDARNTGNASAPKYGIRTVGNACLQ